ncbi:MAG TPA: Ig-like domain-containing protein [Asanoa sp.]
MLRFGRTVAALAVLFAVAAPAAHAADCTTTVSSTSAAASAVTAAAPGATVCLADGTYGKLTLNASKAAPGVMVRAQHPGHATIAGASVDGSYLTVAQFRVTGTFDARPGSTGMTADHNLFVGGNYYGVMAAATSSTAVNDVTITNNSFVGRFNEDAIRLNRYHDGPDSDPYGVLIEGNEFTGNVEYGGHNDVVQTVWVGDHLYFRRNYLHDFGGQGFFIKDQASAIDGLVVEDNLIVRQSSPCDPVSLCPTWQLQPFQIYGPLRNVSIRHNTVWPGSGGGEQSLRGSGWAGPTVFSDNVMGSLSSDASGLTTGYTASNNTRCGGSGFPATGVSSDCGPAFVDPAHGDYRLANGRGVTWTLADQHFGPGDDGTPPPPPGDTTAPHTTITSAPALITLDTSASIGFAVDEAGASSQCRLDDGAWAPCTSPYVVSGLGLGVHTARVRSTDAAGNVESPGAGASWTVIALPSGDSQETSPATDPEDPPEDEDDAPTVDLTTPTSGSNSGRELKLDARAGDDHGVHHFEFWVDRTRVARDTRAPYPARYDARNLRAGSHKVSVRAYDTAGQLATDSVTVRVKTKGRAHSAASNRSRSA